MYTEVTEYDAASGRIIGLHGGPVEALRIDVKYSVPGSYDRNTHYIDLSGPTPEPRARPAMPVTQDKASIGVNEPMTLAELPVPCRVTIGPATYDVPDGTLEWSSPMPATYKIKVEAFPYLDWEGEVKVVESGVHTDE
jgi:hypothetical protein